LRLFSFGGYGLALAALALVVFGAIECPPNKTKYQLRSSRLRFFYFALDGFNLITENVNAVQQEMSRYESCSAMVQLHPT